MRTLRLTVHDDDAGREALPRLRLLGRRNATGAASERVAAGNIVVALADDADELDADLEDVAERVVTGIRQVLNGEELDA